MSLDEALKLSAGLDVKEGEGGASDVSNYVKATHGALEMLATGGLTLDVVKAAHAALLQGGRGGGLFPGEFRRVQNYVCPPGVALADARYIPPPPEDVPAAMMALEQFIGANDTIPPLVKAAPQSETIHPFRDSNGRIGRLLVTLYLCQRGIVGKPLLGMSYFLKKKRDEYHDRLMRIRDRGDWEQWMCFFLGVVSEASVESAGTSRKILLLKDSLHQRLLQNRVGSTHAVGLLDRLFREPYVGVPT